MNKKSKKKNKKKLRSLILLLFLTIVMLSTSTYAWFTANKTVTISPIDVHVATSSGLQISTDATNWKTVISTSDITTGYTGHVNMLPTELVPVSTTGACDTATTVENSSNTTSQGYMKFFKGTVEANDTGTGWELTAAVSPEAAGTTGDFIAFDIFLKAEAPDTSVTSIPIYLEFGSGVTATTGSGTDKGLQFAARYGFVNEGYVAVDATASAAQALNSGTQGIIVEPNFDAHRSTGTIAAYDNYGITTTTAESGVAAVSYVGVAAPITTPIALINTNPGGNPSSTYFTPVSPITTPVAYSNTEQTGSYTLAFNLNPGITKMRVYMWVEGQDVDCENNASGAYLTYNLSLTTNDATPTAGGSEEP